MNSRLDSTADWVPRLGAATGCRLGAYWVPTSPFDWSMGRPLCAVSGSSTPDNRLEETRRRVKLGTRQSIFDALVQYFSRATARLLDIARPAHCTCNQAVPRNRIVRAIKIFNRHALRQRPRIYDFKPVTEQHHLHTRIRRVIAMAHGIYDGLADRIAWKLRSRRRGGVFPVMRAHRKVNASSRI